MKTNISEVPPREKTGERGNIHWCKDSKGVKGGITPLSPSYDRSAGGNNLPPLSYDIKQIFLLVFQKCSERG